MNIFVYDGIVTGENFCGRSEEIERLNKYFADSTNVLLYAKRRMGKTSLIHEIFENHLSKKQFLGIYADIFDISDEQDLAVELYRAVARSMKMDFNLLIKNLRNLFKKATFEIGINHDGTPSIVPKLAARGADELFEDIFEGLFDYVKRHKLKAVFCIDEFQQIKKIKKPIDATIRKYIQKHDKISYVFTGSKKHILQKMFQGSAPLMGMVTPMELGPIDSSDFYFFVKRKLGKKIDQKLFNQLYSAADGEPKLVQHLCRRLNQSSSNVIEEADIKTAIADVVQEYNGICRTIIKNITPAALKVIKIISKYNGKNIFSNEYQLQFNITKATIQAASHSLLKDEFIYKEDNTYYLNGGIGATFALWCKYNLTD